MAIIGPDPSRLTCRIAADEKGPSMVMFDLRKDSERLHFAAKLEDTDVCCIDEIDPVLALSDLTDGHMINVVVNVSGSPKRVQTSLDLVGTLGTIDRWSQQITRPSLYRPKNFSKRSCDVRVCPATIPQQLSRP